MSTGSSKEYEVVAISVEPFTAEELAVDPPSKPIVSFPPDPYHTTRPVPNASICDVGEAYERHILAILISGSGSGPWTTPNSPTKQQKRSVLSKKPYWHVSGAFDQTDNVDHEEQSADAKTCQQLTTSEPEKNAPYQEAGQQVTSPEQQQMPPSLRQNTHTTLNPAAPSFVSSHQYSQQANTALHPQLLQHHNSHAALPPLLQPDPLFARCNSVLYNGRVPDWLEPISPSRIQYPLTPLQEYTPISYGSHNREEVANMTESQRRMVFGFNGPPEHLLYHPRASSRLREEAFPVDDDEETIRRRMKAMEGSSLLDKGPVGEGEMEKNEREQLYPPRGKGPRRTKSNDF